MSSGGPGSGLFKSTDGGDTWTEITKNPGLPSGLWGKVGVSVSPADGNRVYALIENDSGGGLYVSDDAGATWKLINENRNLRQRAFYYTRLWPTRRTRTPSTSSTCSSSSPPTAARRPRNDPRRRTATTTTCGSRPPTTSAWSRPTTAAATSRSTAAARGPTRTIPTGQFYNVFTTKHVPYHVCGAQQDNSTACVGSQANPGAGEGSLPPIFYAVGGGESGYIAPDPNDLNVFYAGSYGGFLSRLDRETGQQRAVNIYPNNPMG